MGRCKVETRRAGDAGGLSTRFPSLRDKGKGFALRL